ncbi:hypothetical protein FE249_11760 [Acidiphilium multivorum]|jgi:hypothetical protein|nr:hypothetical protein FE249_11760 [Acidiphilium multivorum]
MKSHYPSAGRPARLPSPTELLPILWAINLHSLGLKLHEGDIADLDEEVLPRRQTAILNASMTSAASRSVFIDQPMMRLEKRQ